ncbi:MAG TPA: hypothetical protein VJ747_09945 [Stellaceae bacterium]|nr:hypothetical protein [Stellaceae bacterium]
MSNKAASLTGALLASKDAPVRPPAATAAPHPESSDAPRQVTLPLDPTRHRRLRLAAAHLDQTEDALMVAALDHYLDRVVSVLLDGRCACLEEGRTSQACPAATFSSARAERAQ